MSRVVACAVVRDDPPRVFVAEDLDTLQWVLALQVVARTPAPRLRFRDQIREALRNERWGEAVELWMRDGPEVDVYPSFELFTTDDVALGAMELEFTPLFED